jgi:hypothetical protein
MANPQDLHANWIVDHVANPRGTLTDSATLDASILKADSILMHRSRQMPQIPSAEQWHSLKSPPTTVVAPTSEEARDIGWSIDSGNGCLFSFETDGGLSRHRTQYARSAFDHQLAAVR